MNLSGFMFDFLFLFTSPRANLLYINFFIYICTYLPASQVNHVFFKPNGWNAHLFNIYSINGFEVGFDYFWFNVWLLIFLHVHSFCRLVLSAWLFRLGCTWLKSILIYFDWEASCSQLYSSHHLLFIVSNIYPFCLLALCLHAALILYLTNMDNNQ